MKNHFEIGCNQTWNTRDLNKLIHPDNLVSADAHSFTPRAGTYHYDGRMIRRVHDLTAYGYSINPAVPHAKGVHLIIRDAKRGCADGDMLRIPDGLQDKVALHDTSHIKVVIDDRPYLWA